MLNTRFKLPPTAGLSQAINSVRLYVLHNRISVRERTQEYAHSLIPVHLRPNNCYGSQQVLSKTATQLIWNHNHLHQNWSSIHTKT